MQQLTDHHCDHHHRNERAFIRCAFRPRVRISGEGPFAVISRCALPIVQLHGTLEAAIVAKHGLDRDGCQHGCSSRHELVSVDLTASSSSERAA